MRLTTKVKILVIGNVNTSASVKQTLNHVKITVIEIPEINPYGRDYAQDAKPFEIEIHNKNMEAFVPNVARIGELAQVDLIVVPHKKDAAGNTPVTFVVNNLIFDLPF